MKTKFSFFYIVSGIGGATLVHSLAQMSLWLISFGATATDYFLIWLLLLPIPLVLGAVAGILAAVGCRAKCHRWSFIIGMIGMIGAMVSVVFGTDDLHLEPLGSFLIPILSGVVLELLLIGITLIGGYLLNKAHSLIRN